MTFTIDRDSVCAGDDVVNHRQSFELPEHATAKELFQQLKHSRYFPKIAGNNVVWVLTNKTHPFCIFSYFTKRDRLGQFLMDTPLSVLDDGSGLFYLKYYWSPAKWKERIIQEYGDDTYSRWRDGWDTEMELCDKLTRG
ncbi:MAG: hypothetical protein IKH16_00040 [Selenomonadaceae bacterium]|nr:hypothetical protein [Selenomonadaceae bacterium]